MFADPPCGVGKLAATSVRDFDKLCAASDIEHRLTLPKWAQTNGMVERFNGRIWRVPQSHQFRSDEALEATLHRYVWLFIQNSRNPHWAASHPCRP
jgi:hypothetical protein